MKNITLISATSKQLKQVNKILQRLFKMYYLEGKNEDMFSYAA